MAATTITRTAMTETSAQMMTLTDDRGRTCVIKVWSDASREAVGGATWLLKATEQSFGRSNVTDALRAAYKTGSATVTRS